MRYVCTLHSAEALALFWLCTRVAAPILHLSTKVPLSGTKFSKHPKSPPAPPEKAQKPRESERRGAPRARRGRRARPPTRARASGRAQSLGLALASRLHYPLVSESHTSDFFPLPITHIFI